MSNFSWSKALAWKAALLIGALLVGNSAHAVVLYSQDFEPPVPLSSTSVGPGGFVQVTSAGWEVQGGGGAGGVSLVTGIDVNGAGGSQGLFGIWDHTPAASGFFTFNQYTTYGLPAPGAGVAANQVKVSMDILIDGSTTNNPINIHYQIGGNKSFTPVLANGVYTPVSFTLDQTTGGPAFDPTLSFNLRVEHGAGGFEFDANNIVRIDNVRVEVIPEPVTCGLAATAALGLFIVRRKRS